MTTYDVYFDGSCEPRNPGGWATYGWRILDENGDVVESARGLAAEQGSPLSTNNFAEYAALGFALRWLVDNDRHGKVRIFGDSQLVVKQLIGEWRCNKPNLQKLRDRCLELLKEIGDFTTTWIPREQNEECDSLARLAYEEVTRNQYPSRRR